MTISGTDLWSYLSEISTFQNRNIELNWIEREFIQLFAERPYLYKGEISTLHNSRLRPITSKYIPTKIKRSYKKPMKPEKVLMRMKKLHDLKLIETFEKVSNRHRKYYTLSKGGIYYVIGNGISIHGQLLKPLLRNHPENIIFKTFLYPYFESNTLLKITDFDVASATSLITFGILISRISAYLNRCCNETEIALSSLSSINKGSDAPHFRNIFVWQRVPGDNDAHLLHFLKQKFDFNWIANDKLEIAKSEDRHTIWISHRSNVISIKLSKKIDSAIIKNKGKKISELPVLVVDDELYVVGYLDPEGKKQMLEGIVTDFKNYLISSVSTLILAITLDLQVLPELYRVILSEDATFIQALSRVKEEFDVTNRKFYESYSQLMAIRK